MAHSPQAPRRHFSMIRGFHLADFFTLANAASGMVAVLLAMAFLESHSLAQFYLAAAMSTSDALHCSMTSN